MLSATFLIEKLSLVFRSYGKVFDEGLTEIWGRALNKFDQTVVNSACDKWCATERKAPLLADLVDKCSRLQHWVDEKNPSMIIARCEYSDLDESVHSRELCRQVTQADVDGARVQGWPVMCQWHYEVTYAKAFPESGIAALVKSQLELAEKNTNTACQPKLEQLAPQIFKRVSV